MDSGFLYFVAYGRKYLYCAGKDTWTDEKIRSYGYALCQHTRDTALINIERIKPTGGRTYVGKDIGFTLSPEAMQDFESCTYIYIHCHRKPLSYGGATIHAGGSVH